MSAKNEPKLSRLTPIVRVEQEPGYEWAHVRWLRRQVYEGGLGSYRVAGKVLVDLDELDALVQAGRREPLDAS